MADRGGVGKYYGGVSCPEGTAAAALALLRGRHPGARLLADRFRPKEHHMEQSEIHARIKEAASRVMELEAELETAGEATTQGEKLAFARAALHQWVDSVVAVVASPGVGRVTLIHANGNESKIASPELPYLVTPPVTWEKK